MNLEISYIPPSMLSDALNGMYGYLLKSEMWTRGRATAEDILDFLFTGRMQLWLVYDAESLRGYGYVITEVKDYPQCKMLVAQYCAGEPNHMKHVEDKMYIALEQFARSADCAGIEFFGRPGWGSHVKKRGYTVQTVVYEKYFNEVHS
jgi:hypothetical protein